MKNNWQCPNCKHRALAVPHIKVRCPKCAELSGPVGPPPKTKYGWGVGTRLHSLLSRVGLQEVPGCKCPARIRAMNKRGIKWCDGNRKLIVAWLREEAERRNLDWTKPRHAGAHLILDISIRWARRESKTNLLIRK